MGRRRRAHNGQSISDWRGGVGESDSTASSCMAWVRDRWAFVFIFSVGRHVKADRTQNGVGGVGVVTR